MLLLPHYNTVRHSEIYNPFDAGHLNLQGSNVLRTYTPPSRFPSWRLPRISSLDAIISEHMLKMAWQPLRKP